MRIRHYTPRDLRTVVDIFQRAVHEGSASYYTPAQLAAWAPHPPEVMRWTIELALGMVWVCDDAGGTPVGFIHIARDGLLRNLYVEPQSERVGVASSLLHTAMNWAREERLETLRADAFEASRPFFERHGFVMDDYGGERNGLSKSLRTKPMLKPLVTTTSAT